MSKKEFSLTFGLIREPESALDATIRAENTKDPKCICSRPQGRFSYLSFYHGDNCPKNNTPECVWYDADLGISVRVA